MMVGVVAAAMIMMTDIEIILMISRYALKTDIEIILMISRYALKIYSYIIFQI